VLKGAKHMEKILKEAVRSYVKSIEVEVKDCKVTPTKGFVAKVDIDGDLNYSIFLVVPKYKLDYIAGLWFGDKNDYDVEDLTKEISNLIVGNAKVIAQKKGKNFNISTPQFLGEYKNIEYDDILKFKFHNRCFYLLFKVK
jgi:CheY-specific phosphatase CheX